MPKDRYAGTGLSAEARKLVHKLDREEAVRQKQIRGVRKADGYGPAFDQLLAVVKEHGAEQALAWLAAGRDLEASVIREETHFQAEEKQRSVLVTEVAD